MANKLYKEKEGREAVKIIRYEGAKRIEAMREKGQYVEAFFHTQLGIERILWNKIVGIFTGEKAMIVRRTIEENRGGQNKTYTRTSELIKWTHFLGVIDNNEFGDLVDFNGKRNRLLHGHGKWWNPNIYDQALKKGIKFLEENGM